MTSPAELCLLFADVAGSTRLYETVGDAEALRAVERCLSVMRRVTETYHGRVIKTIGDEVMCAFESAEYGMQAASEMQQRISELPPLGEIRLAIRVGFHFGAVVEVEGDLFGDTVNTAARMAGLARANQIFTTQSTVEALPELLRASTRDLDALAVKGKANDVNVYEVIWQENSELTMKAPSPQNRKASVTRLKLRCHGIEIVLDGTSEPLVMGREAGCGLVVSDTHASRQHARIERQRDKFVLFDQSTNGTYLKIGTEEAVLKHEMMPLHGAGLIGFGQSVDDAGPEALQFAVIIQD
jgi:adenylate cyclase